MAKNTTPQPKQARAHETIQLLIDATDKVIRSQGEAAVRIQDISAETGISIGSIYHHFGDRDGLIRATQVHQFADTVKTDMPRVKRFMEEMHSTQEIADRYDEMLRFVKSHFNHQSAIERIAVIGNTAGRPLMMNELISAQTDLIDSATEAITPLYERGLFKDHLTARSVSVIMLGMLMGRTVSELDANPVSEEAWARAMLSAFSGMFKSETAKA
jgi:AcrR family transcriptional regulator